MSKLTSYATNAIGNLIPLDTASCQEIVEYALTLPSDDAIQVHFFNLLGESEDSLRFITKFLELKHEQEQTKKEHKIKTTAAPQKVPTNTWVNEPAAKPKATKKRLEGNTTSKTTSELMDIKPSNQLSSQQAKKSKRKNVDNLKDIEAILNELEISTSDPSVMRSCNCMATKHPLFELAPNCLNCGKIICAKEGLQPCSYCGQDLLTVKDKREIINVLQEEKDLIANKVENIKNKKIQEQALLSSGKPKKIVVTLNAGENLWDAQDRALKKAELEKKKVQEALQQAKEDKEELEQQTKELEYYQKTAQVNPDLLKAQERLETLLNFQDTGAERTRIIDNAADYELPSSSGNIWLSPVERALQLKKQQKQLRKMAELVLARTGRANKSVEMVIKDGKVTMVEKRRQTKDEEVDPDIEDLEHQLRNSKMKKEENMARNIWDYESDSKKWDKPVYISHGSVSDETVSAPKPRVQFAFDADQNELLLEIPS